MEIFLERTVELTTVRLGAGTPAGSASQWRGAGVWATFSLDAGRAVGTAARCDDANNGETSIHFARDIRRCSDTMRVETNETDGKRNKDESNLTDDFENHDACGKRKFGSRRRPPMMADLLEIAR